jgi:hypothetical protein
MTEFISKGSFKLFHSPREPRFSANVAEASEIAYNGKTLTLLFKKLKTKKMFLL